MECPASVYNRSWEAYEIQISFSGDKVDVISELCAYIGQFVGKGVPVACSVP